MSRAPAKYGSVGRADLLRLLRAGGDAERLAEYVGYEYRPEVVPEIPLRAPAPARPHDAKLDPVPSDPFNPTPLEFLFPSGFRSTTVPAQAPQPVVEHIPRWQDAPQISPRSIPLATSQTIENLIGSLIAEKLRGRRLDVAQAVATLAKAQPLDKIPRNMVRRASTLQIIADRSRHLAPFWADQVSFVSELGKRPFTLWVFDELEMRIVHLESHEAREPNPVDGPIVSLGDLGAYGSAEHRRFWLGFGQRLGRVGGQLAALAPCPSDDIPASLAKVWSPRPWEPPLASTQHETRDEHVEDLLALASPVARLEPGLLRALRRNCTTADPTAEVLVWRHEALASSNLAGATFKPDAASRYREKFHQLARQDPDRAKRAWSEIRAWRGRIGYEFMFEEILDLPEDVRECIVPTDDITAADRFWHEIGDAAQAGTLQTEALRWLHETSFRRPPDSRSGALWGHPGAYKALKRGASSVEPLQTRQLTLAQKGPDLVLGEKVQGAPLALLGDASGIVEILPVSNFPPPLTTFRDPLADGTFGPEMVSIPTGSFMMGSPHDEKGRDENEGPQHKVQIDQAFALSTYPVTFNDYYRFCDATGRRKPFRKLGMLDGNRPVTYINWEDAISYAEWLNSKTGKPYRLPSEAEWEYAARAGTTDRYWWGNDWRPDLLNTVYENEGASPNVGSDQPIQSGLFDPELLNAVDKNEGENPKVGSGQPNQWGLFDMLGTVSEWCQDVWVSDYRQAREQRPLDSKLAGDFRVYRNGAQQDRPLRMRSAYRYRASWDTRSSSIGFRIACDIRSDAPIQHIAKSESVPSPTIFSLNRAFRESGATIPLTDLPSTPFVIRTDRAELVIQRITRSDLGSWASGMGRDRFGLWADFALDDIRQRLRWCPPGRFLMGTPEDEPGRYDDEGSQTEVTFSKGFWIFDTPVMQDLYEAVMGDNPSRFRSKMRPVEKVDFMQAQKFLEMLNGRLPGLELRLPFESEWEYACRAGTTDATYAGPIEFISENNAPVLDEIAWYGGNSGKDFELEEGHDSTVWPGKQFDHNKAGTMPVKMKRANPWGLYDTLGNVWEWCAEVWQDSHDGAAPDHTARQASKNAGEMYRVIRGGSWFLNARVCRPGYRYRSGPEDQRGIIGFRPARGQASGGQAGNQGNAARPSIGSLEGCDEQREGPRTQRPR